MVNEAERNRVEDERRAELITARNEADSMIYQVEKSLNDLGNKVPDADRQQIEAQVASLRSVMESDDVQTIRSNMENLRNASYALSQQMYAQQGDGAQGSQQAPEDDDIIEGEYSEV